jgi:chromosome segregation ATPase
MYRIAELERITCDLRQDVRELRAHLAGALARVDQLEAEHQADAQREAWELREAAERGREPVYGPPDDEDEPKPAEYDPGPEIDDEGGMSEYRYLWPEDYERGGAR